MPEENWELAGTIGVDAGLCWIGDPCYAFGSEVPKYPFKNWGEFVDKNYSDESKPLDMKGVTAWPFESGNNGLGISMNTFHGDGVYEVYVDRDDKGRIKAAKVVFEDGSFTGERKAKEGPETCNDCSDPGPEKCDLVSTDDQVEEKS